MLAVVLLVDAANVVGSRPTGASLTGPGKPVPTSSARAGCSTGWSEARRFERFPAPTEAGENAGMRLSLQFGPSASFKETARNVADLEHAGLDVVWVGEAY